VRRRIRLADATRPEQWDDLVGTFAGASSLLDWSWLRFQAEVLDLRLMPKLVLVGDEPCGVLPLLLRRRGPLSYGPMVPFPFVGPLVPVGLLGETLHAVRRWQARSAIPQLRLDLAPVVTPDRFRLSRRPGWTVEEQRTMAVDLRHGSAERLRASFNRNTRRALKAAEQHDVVVRPAAPGELARLLPRVLDEAYEGRGTPSPYPAELGERLEGWLSGRSDVHAVTTTVGGEPAGVLVTLGSRPTATSWAGGCFRRFRASNANTVQHVAMLEWALGRGHEAVDLAGTVDAGVTRFKAALGAEPHPYLSLRSSFVPQVVHRARGLVRGGAGAGGGADPAQS
jgi:hypothetical protein